MGETEMNAGDKSQDLYTAEYLTEKGWAFYCEDTIGNAVDACRFIGKKHNTYARLVTADGDIAFRVNSHLDASVPA
jgi:hypothetical protein